MAAPKLTKAKILESIRQMMSTDIDENMAVVLYEGDADRMFAEHYLNDENIFFFESPSGKTGLYELLRDTADKPYADRVVAIRDRDYSDPAEYPPRLFAYDDCALLGAFSKMGANTLGEAGYRAFLFTTYRVSDFRSSALFRSLRQYGEEHGLSIVRVEENGEVS